MPTNRLIHETSPYLLQHAHNPVDWYAWGDEAFEAAREQDKPIFLSVGYSTCYWCHVMERQCFENEAIAKVMNELFINIKVDREERPDVDQLYMTAVQVLTQHGGWPMSVFLLPDLRPFYGGTYFPPEDAHGRPGFPTLLRGIAGAYKDRRADVDASAEQLVSILQQFARPAAASKAITIDEKLIDELITRSIADYDPSHGGFGTAPKFPRETLLELLLTHLAQSKIQNPKSKIEPILRHTLDAMANGGIRDHLGGAFHRYSTDARWLVPHFEIMLYDNAMLAWCYVEAYRQFGEPRYAQIARDIFWFVNEELTSPEGAFYTALDAEVDAQEGGSYLWTPQQIQEVLGPVDAKTFNRVYGLDRGFNFADPHGASHMPDKNVLYMAEQVKDDASLRTMRERLYRVRRQRKQPRLDDKIITSWNALMIRALAFAGNVLNEPHYTAAADSAARFLLSKHRTVDGRLYRTSRDGKPKYRAFLDDYAFLAQALLELGRREEAQKLTQQMVEQFADAGGGFYFTDRNASELIIRQMIGSDSPLPSGNAVAAMVMQQLDEPNVSRDVLTSFAGHLHANAEGMGAMVQATMLHVGKYGAISVEAAPQAAPDRASSPRDIAAGVVSIRGVEWTDSRTLQLKLAIGPAYHINANRASAGLVPTELRVLSGQVVQTIDYPPPQALRADFADVPLDVYVGEVEIVVHFSAPVTEALTLRLQYQACDDSACLPAVAKQFPVAGPA